MYKIKQLGYLILREKLKTSIKLSGSRQLVWAMVSVEVLRR
jgi:hypothetical protein